MKPYTTRLQGSPQGITPETSDQKKHICPDAKILDAGCDTGKDAIYLSAKYSDSQIIGLDISTQAIDGANFQDQNSPTLLSRPLILLILIIFSNLILYIP